MQELAHALLDLQTTKAMMLNNAANVSNQLVANTVNVPTWTPATLTLLLFLEHATALKDTQGLCATNFNARTLTALS